MENSTKKVAREIASLLESYGIRKAVLSPGSRNTPLIIAIERQPKIETKVVIDERSAAFIALGMAIGAREPVAIVCTSGTAPLNYAPALAEAFYRRVPLIAITADRPEEWIDQDDSQTINQPGIFSNFIKGTFDIPVENENADREWMINRKLNDALRLATTGIPGPVHINVRLSEPLGETAEFEESLPRIIQHRAYAQECVSEVCSELATEIASGKKTMFLCGFMSNPEMSVYLQQLSYLPNVVVLHEAQSNVSAEGKFIPNIDATLATLGGEEDVAAPEVVVTLGGSLTSRKIKNYLRKCPELKHWSIGRNNHAIDIFRKLAGRIDVDEIYAVKSLTHCLASEKIGEDTAYKKVWRKASEFAKKGAEEYATAAPWSDFKAMEYIVKNLPAGVNLHLSNGTSVRYVQLFDYSKASAIECNRGVSGIDGCTSTAIGAATACESPTWLITGDMSMQYDMGALATTFIPDNFKIIILNNGGGGIFRYIPSTRNLKELERCFVADVRLPLEELSRAFGINYFSAGNYDELKRNFTEFSKCDIAPSILEIKTDGVLSAEVLSQFLDKQN